VFLTFYITGGGQPKRRGTRGNLPPTLPLVGPGCVNNALINALKKLTLRQLYKIVIQRCVAVHVLNSKSVTWTAFELVACNNQILGVTSPSPRPFFEKNFKGSRSYCAWKHARRTRYSMCVALTVLELMALTSAAQKRMNTIQWKHYLGIHSVYLVEIKSV